VIIYNADFSDHFFAIKELNENDQRWTCEMPNPADIGSLMKKVCEKSVGQGRRRSFKNVRRPPNERLRRRTEPFSRLTSFTIPVTFSRKCHPSQKLLRSTF
jgi:hypothetical protein